LESCLCAGRVRAVSVGDLWLSQILVFAMGKSVYKSAWMTT
jgi:hypothetical protein